MEKLTLPPSEESFALSYPSSAFYEPLAGGLGRYRKDLIDASKRASVKWITDRRGYEYLWAFYNRHIDLDCESFPIDLAIDGVTLTTVQANFVPKTLKTESVEGLRYTVTAELEIGGFTRSTDSGPLPTTPLAVAFFDPISQNEIGLAYENSGAISYVGGAGYQVGIVNLPGGSPTVVWSITWYPVDPDDDDSPPLLSDSGAGIGDAHVLAPVEPPPAGVVVVSATVNGQPALRAQMSFAGGAYSEIAWGPVGS